MLLEHRNYALKNGAILGIIYCCATICIYFLDVKMLFSGFVYPIIFWVLFFLFPVYVVKRTNIIFSKFKELFSVIFLIFVSGIFLDSLFNWILYNLIDKNLIEIYVSIMMEKINKNSLLLSYNIEGFNEEFFSKNFSIKSQINSYVFFLIPCVLYSAFLSLIMKNRK